MSVQLNAVTDALGWPDTITVTYVYDGTSPDGKVRRTGSATFVFTRQHLADALARPKLFCDVTYLPPTASAKFLPVQYALGKMPGWQVSFGPQPTQVDAITVTTTFDDGSVATTHEDANCALFMACMLCAPGRRSDYGNFLGLDFARFLGLNAGNSFEPTLTANAPYTVELIYAGSAATGKLPEVGPVYRVTIPSDVGAIGEDGMTISLNGESITMGPRNGILFLSAGGNYGAVDFNLNLLGSMLAEVAATADPRSPYVCDVQLAHFGDTLAAGTLSYHKKAAPADSPVFLSPGGQITLPDPFAMTSLDLTYTDPGGAFTATITAG